eukprot:3648973-Amphidinium_carterae.1
MIDREGSLGCMTGEVVRGVSKDTMHIRFHIFANRHPGTASAESPQVLDSEGSRSWVRGAASSRSFSKSDSTALLRHKKHKRQTCGTLLLHAN